MQRRKERTSKKTPIYEENLSSAVRPVAVNPAEKTEGLGEEEAEDIWDFMLAQSLHHPNSPQIVPQPSAKHKSKSKEHRHHKHRRGISPDSGDEGQDLGNPGKPVEVENSGNEPVADQNILSYPQLHALLKADSQYRLLKDQFAKLVTQKLAEINAHPSHPSNTPSPLPVPTHQEHQYTQQSFTKSGSVGTPIYEQNLSNSVRSMSLNSLQASSISGAINACPPTNPPQTHIPVRTPSTHVPTANTNNGPPLQQQQPSNDTAFAELLLPLVDKFLSANLPALQYYASHQRSCETIDDEVKWAQSLNAQNPDKIPKDRPARPPVSFDLEQHSHSNGHNLSRTPPKQHSQYFAPAMTVPICTSPYPPSASPYPVPSTATDTNRHQAFVPVSVPVYYPQYVQGYGPTTSVPYAVPVPADPSCYRSSGSPRRCFHHHSHPSKHACSHHRRTSSKRRVSSHTRRHRCDCCIDETGTHSTLSPSPSKPPPELSHRNLQHHTHPDISKCRPHLKSNRSAFSEASGSGSKSCSSTKSCSSSYTDSPRSSWSSRSCSHSSSLITHSTVGGGAD